MKSGVLEDIKSRIDIVDFISSYVSLKQAGRNWKGLCPFHSEKTPSFTVSPDKQVFHCFGCGAGGDVIAFAVKYENLSFREALEMLAKKAGISLPEKIVDRAASMKQELLRKALSVAADFFMKKLSETPSALEYLKKRGVGPDAVREAGIGFAPAGWDNLLKYFRRSGIDERTAKEAGLAVQGSKGVYDMFRQRLMFPIKSTGGHVIAFGGRAMDDSTPKYINSPETGIFRKSETLFGLYEAKDHIRRESVVMIVEGYMDVVICRQFGFRNAVAPLGTSLTQGQSRKLRTLAGRALLAFDGDKAGRAAARRALGILCGDDFSVRVVLLPEGEDPDSYLKKFGPEAFGALMENASTPVEFLLKTSPAEKNETVREALRLAAGLRDNLAADDMIRELADKTRIAESALRAEFAAMRSPQALSSQTGGGASSKDRDAEATYLLRVAVAFPEKADHIFSRLDLGDLRDEKIVGLFRKISSFDGWKDIPAAMERLDAAEKKELARLLVDPGFDPEFVDKNIEDCLRRIENRKMGESMRNAESSGNLELMNALLMKKRRMEKK